MGITFCDEFNENNKSIIDYSDATEPSSNHSDKDLTRFVRIPSAGVRRVGFVNFFCLTPLIRGSKFFLDHSRLKPNGAKNSRQLV